MYIIKHDQTGISTFGYEVQLLVSRPAYAKSQKRLAQITLHSGVLAKRKKMKPRDAKKVRNLNEEVP